MHVKINLEDKEGRMDALQAITYMMAKTKTSPAELARATGKSPQNISKLVNRRVDDMLVSNFAHVASAMGYSLKLTDGEEDIDLG